MFQGLDGYIDGREIADGTLRDCDLCIIGAGAAGIALALELAASGLDICLVESGGLGFDEETDRLNTLKIAGRQYSARGTRLRYFGGTTNHWGGHCVPLRPDVFDRREWIPYSGWPFGIGEMHRYYERAHRVLEIGPYDYDPGPVAARLGQRLFPFDPGKVQSSLSRYHRQRFGRRFRRQLEASGNVSVLLHSTVVSINLDRYRRRVTDVSVRTLAGNGFGVRARRFVLATGGIENARLLLQSRSQVPAGLGNRHDLVGRFFQEHIWYASGLVVPVDQDIGRVDFYRREIPYERLYGVRGHLVLSEALLREFGIPEYRVELQVRRAEDPTAASVEEMMPLFARAASSPGKGSGYRVRPLVYEFANYVEQVPNPDSRVTLSDDTDALGQPRASLNWRLSALDKEGIRRAQEVIALEVGRTGIGRMQMVIPDQEETLLHGAGGGNHHMGTTRMHQSPRQGVVDANCRIHDLANIYVAGSSVFPVSGFANPTLTIVALALRLADHLKSRSWHDF